MAEMGMMVAELGDLLPLELDSPLRRFVRLCQAPVLPAQSSSKMVHRKTVDIHIAAYFSSIRDPSRIATNNKILLLVLSSPMKVRSVNPSISRL